MVGQFRWIELLAFGQKRALQSSCPPLSPPWPSSLANETPFKTVLTTSPPPHWARFCKISRILLSLLAWLVGWLVMERLLCHGDDLCLHCKLGGSLISQQFWQKGPLWLPRSWVDFYRLIANIWNVFVIFYLENFEIFNSVPSWASRQSTIERSDQYGEGTQSCQGTDPCFDCELLLLLCHSVLKVSPGIVKQTFQHCFCHQSMIFREKKIVSFFLFFAILRLQAPPA